jgi:hypothetical protein
MRMTSSSLRQIRSKQPYTLSSAAYAQMVQMQAATLKEIGPVSNGGVSVTGARVADAKFDEETVRVLGNYLIRS